MYYISDHIFLVGEVTGLAYNKTSRSLYYTSSHCCLNVIKDVEATIIQAEYVVEMDDPRSMVLDECSG